MRLIGSLDNERDSLVFSSFLTRMGIVHMCEEEPVGEEGGEGTRFVIWIHDEDTRDQASLYLAEFKVNPKDPRFILREGPPQPLLSLAQDQPLIRPTVATYPKPHQSTLTWYTFFLCCSLFVWTAIQQPNLSTVPNYLPAFAVSSSPIVKRLVYDYPKAFELADRLVALYGVDRLEDPSQLPPEGQALLREYRATPYWQGLYQELLRGPSGFHHYQGPLFEKISQGEWWRPLTPCFLHADIFHLLFNMLWVILLGPQIEMRVGAWRYVLFLIVSGAFSNTAQYVMGGPAFLGFSGIICAMLTFIWARQHKAPWEGYLLHRSTIAFIAVFVVAMLAIQLVSFFFEALENFSFSPGVANTAHLSGALIGYLIGRLNFFSMKP